MFLQGPAGVLLPKLVARVSQLLGRALPGIGAAPEMREAKEVKAAQNEEGANRGEAARGTTESLTDTDTETHGREAGAQRETRDKLLSQL